MKRLIITTFLCMASLFVTAQSKLTYAYDANGNRISRTIILNHSQAKKHSFSKSPSSYEDMLADVRIKIQTGIDYNSVTISITGYDTTLNCEYSVYTAGGAHAASGRLSNQNTKIDLTDYPNGVYVLKIRLGEKSTSWKIIKR